MMDVERELLLALRDLDEKVALMPTANPKPSLLPVFERIEALGDRLDRTGTTELRHYLKNKSYQKARLYLEGRDAENARGTCR